MGTKRNYWKVSDSVSGKVFAVLRKASSRRRSGFTLAELIVAVAVLAVLATVGFLAFSGYSGDAKDAAAKANARSVLTAVRSESAISWTTPRRYVVHDSSLSWAALSWAFVEFDGNRTYLTWGAWNAPGTNYSAGNPDWAALRLDPSKFRISGPGGPVPRASAAYDAGSVLLASAEAAYPPTAAGKARVRSFTQAAAILPSWTAYVTGDTPSFSSATGSSAGLIRDPSSPSSTWALADSSSVTVPAGQSALQSPPYSLANSLRFDSGRASYLSRTPTVVGNRKTWTWSGWVKRNVLANGTIVDAGSLAGDYYTRIDFNANHQLYLLVGIPGSNPHLATSSAVFRDTSAWYHIVWKTDTTQSDPNLRFRLFVNGSEVTMNRTATVPQNFDTTFNSTGYKNTISGSARTDSYAIYGDAYFSDVNFVDGQALDPSSFGEVDPASGSWRPKRYSGTYGTNGFRLDFSSWATLAWLGLDSAPAEATGHVSANNWTPSGISVTDQTIDNPTNNFATLNPLRDGTLPYSVFSNGNLTMAGSVGYTLGTQFVQSWKWYAEFVQQSWTNAGDYCEVRGVDYSSEIWYQPNWTIGGLSWVTSAVAYSAGDVIGIGMDVDANTVTFYKNGAAVASWTAAVSIIGKPMSFWVKVATWSSAIWNVNFWQGGQAWLTFYPDAGWRFKYAPPAGFKALSTANMPMPAIANPKSQFDVALRNGNGGAGSVSWLGFQPDFVWSKSRTAGVAGYLGHYLVDSVRGGSRPLQSDQTVGEGDNAQIVTGWNSDGYSFGTYAGLNGAGQTYVDWLWKAGGAAVANNAGSMPSQVSANAAAGFSIITYSGNWAGWTIGHWLSKAPEFIISKSRNSSGHWTAYHRSMNGANPEYWYLDLNLSQGYTLEGAWAGRTRWWQNVQPGPTTFTIWAGSSDQLNVNGSTYVAYAFNSVPGYSKFGSYVGNGIADGPFMNLGFRPKYLMVKRANTSWSWAIMDSVRESVNDGSASTAYADLPQSGDAGSNSVDFLSNGFKIRDTWTATNSSWDTYVYAAFAEAPFWWAGVAPATAR